MPPKHKGMIVHCGHGRCSRSTDVGKDSFAISIGTYTTEVGVVKWWLGVLVEGRMLASDSTIIELCRRSGIPRYAEAVNIEETVASGNFMLCGDIIGVV